MKNSAALAQQAANRAEAAQAAQNGAAAAAAQQASAALAQQATAAAQQAKRIFNFNKLTKINRIDLYANSYQHANRLLRLSHPNSSKQLKFHKVKIFFFFLQLIAEIFPGI